MFLFVFVFCFSVITATDSERRKNTSKICSHLKGFSVEKCKKGSPAPILWQGSASGKVKEAKKSQQDMHFPKSLDTLSICMLENEYGRCLNAFVEDKCYLFSFLQSKPPLGHEARNASEHTRVPTWGHTISGALQTGGASDCELWNGLRCNGRRFCCWNDPICCVAMRFEGSTDIDTHLVTRIYLYI